MDKQNSPLYIWKIFRDDADCSLRNGRAHPLAGGQSPSQSPLMASLPLSIENISLLSLVFDDEVETFQNRFEDTTVIMLFITNPWDFKKTFND